MTAKSNIKGVAAGRESTSAKKTAQLVTVKSNTKGVAAGRESISAEKTVQCEVYDSFEQLRTIQQQWDQFIESVGSEIFLTYDWCRIWWKYYGKNRDLRVFIFRSDDELVGIIPLFFEKIWLGPIFVRAGKIVGSDFTLSQFCLPLDQRYTEAIIEKWSQVIYKDKWDILHIGPLAGLYNHYGELKAACEKLFGRHCSVKAGRKGDQTYFKMADSWDEQFLKIGKKHRRNMKRSYRYLLNSTDGQSAEVKATFATSKNVDKQFNAFVQMHQSYWSNRNRGGHFHDWPKSRNFHFDMARIQQRYNRLRLLEITVGSQCLGYEYDYWFGGTCFELLASRPTSQDYERVSLGKMNYVEKMKKAIEGKITVIDSMRGEYEYKLSLGGELHAIRSIYIISKGLSKWIRVYLFWVLAWFLDICYYQIWFSRIACHLPFKPRALWSIWIRSSYSI